MKIAIHETPSDRWQVTTFNVIRTRFETNEEKLIESLTMEGALTQFADWLAEELDAAPQVAITPMHHEIVGGKHGGKQGTLIAKGWHDNYSTFKTEMGGKKIEGCITYVGDGAMLEVGKDHRFQLKFQDVIQHCVRTAVADA